MPTCDPSSIATLLDWGKTLSATFIGAALAFASNFLLQRHLRQRENLAAGNMALAMLSQQYGDYCIFWSALQTDIEIAIGRGTPDWLSLRPSLFFFSESTSIELDSLAFLAEHRNHAVLKDIVLAAQTYDDLRTLIKQNTEACAERDQLLDTSLPAGEVDYSLDWAGATVPASSKALLGALATGLLRRAEPRGEVFRRSGKGLREVLVANYGEDRVFPFQAVGVKSDPFANEKPTQNENR